MDQKQRFTEIFNKNLFGGRSSRSGEGSSLEQTTLIREELPRLFKELDVQTLLDAPCGDWNWMRMVDLTGISYVGIDIVDQIIQKNIERYAKSGIKFMPLDIIKDPLPTADLIFCRDCLVHLSYADIFRTLDNFKKSKSKYLLTTTFPSFKGKNVDLLDGEIWRALNLEEPPLSFSPPLIYIIERNFGAPFYEKALGLWYLNK